MDYNDCEDNSFTADEKKLFDEVPAEIRSMIGMASSITEEDIAMDDKLAYLLNLYGYRPKGCRGLGGVHLRITYETFKTNL